MVRRHIFKFVVSEESTNILCDPVAGFKGSSAEVRVFVFEITVELVAESGLNAVD